jgi:hypothetical protein
MEFKFNRALQMLVKGKRNHQYQSQTSDRRQSQLYNVKGLHQTLYKISRKELMRCK